MNAVTTKCFTNDGLGMADPAEDDVRAPDAADVDSDSNPEGPVDGPTDAGGQGDGRADDDGPVAADEDADGTVDATEEPAADVEDATEEPAADVADAAPEPADQLPNEGDAIATAPGGMAAATEPETSEAESAEPPYVATADEQADRATPTGLPDPVKWHPVVKPMPIAFGVFADVGWEIAQQQLGNTILDTDDLIYNAAEGAILGIVAPSLGLLIGVLWVNSKIRSLRGASA